MSDYCPGRFDDLCACVAGELTGESGRSLKEHLSGCPGCRTYFEKLQADHELLTRFSETLEPTFSRIEKNVIKNLKIPVPRLDWRRVIKTRWASVGAAAAIMIAVFTGIFLFIGSPGVAKLALADVKEAFLAQPWVHVKFDNGREQWISLKDGKIYFSHDIINFM